MGSEPLAGERKGGVHVKELFSYQCVVCRKREYCRVE